jgi:DNA-binding CsgD family transcriptional regulator
MGREDRLHQLIDLIYEAAIEPAVWKEVVAAMSELYEGAAVLLGIGLPSDGRIDRHYSCGIVPEYRAGYTEHLVNGLPWKAAYTHGYTDRFGSLGEVFPDIELCESGFYESWLAPQALASEWPIGHTILIEGDVMVGGLGVFRHAKSKSGPFRKADLALGDRLVRHLARAFVVHTTLGGVRRERLALAEIMDRLPTGVILLDDKRQAVVTNHSADRILGLDDGFRVGAGGPCASNARENASLQMLLADVLEASSQEANKAGFLAISRPSGKRSFPLMVTKLLAAPPGSQVRDAVAAIFVSDPDSGLVSATELLEAIYSLTHSEAELVRLLSQGKSLEQAAEARGIAINTARSHLKRIFSKTDTRRQGELVRLVLSGVGSMTEV